jgi:hypothetical protein
MEAPIFSEDPSRRQNKFKIWMNKFKKEWNFLAGIDLVIL